MKKIFIILFRTFLLLIISSIVIYGYFAYQKVNYNSAQYDYIYRLEEPNDYARRTTFVSKEGIEKSNIYASDIEIAEDEQSTNYFDVYYLNNNKQLISLKELPDGMSYVIHTIIHYDDAGTAFIKGTIKHKDNYKLNAGFSQMLTDFKKRDKIVGSKSSKKAIISRS